MGIGVLQLPEYIVKHLEDNVGILPALTRAHVETNQEVRLVEEAEEEDTSAAASSVALRSLLLLAVHCWYCTQMHDASFDDSMSGTTSISVLFHGNEIHIANVGDSRAIIAQDNLKATGPYEDISLVAKPLSIDQTPFRKVGRDEVVLCCAVLCCMEQR